MGLKTNKEIRQIDTICGVPIYSSKPEETQVPQIDAFEKETKIKAEIREATEMAIQAQKLPGEMLPNEKKQQGLRTRNLG